MASSDVEKQLANLSPAKRALLEKKLRESSAAPRLQKRQSQGPVRLSSAQQRFWLIHELDRDSYLYNVPRLVRLTGNLDVVALQASLNEIVRRHEALRTSFRVEDGRPVQVISPQLTVQLAIADISSHDGESPLQTAINEALQQYRRPFDLASGPILRANLWKLSERDHVLLLVVHHIASDGWSGGVLFDELGKLYDAFSRGEPSPIPELPVQYADFAAWESEWLNRVADKQVEYWRSRLSGAPPSLDLPTDHERPSPATFQGHLRSLPLEPELANKIIAFARSQDSTLFPLMLAALQTLIYRWTKESDLVLGTVSASRNSAELEKIIGCFLNFLALRDRIAGEDSLQQLIEKSKKTVLDAFANQDCPFEKVVEAINPDRGASSNPLYNVSLLVQNYPAFAFRGGEIEARFLPLNTQVAFLDLRFMVTETTGKIVLECECNADLFEQETADLLLEAYRGVLAQMVADPARRIDQVALPQDLLSQAEAARRTTTLAIASTFTAEPIEPALKFWMRRLGIRSKVKFAPFNQVVQQLLDPSSLFSRNDYGSNIILLRMEDLAGHEIQDDDQFARRIELETEEFLTALHASAARLKATYMVCFCPPSASVQASPQRHPVCDRVQSTMVRRIGEMGAVSAISWQELLELYPVSNFQDAHAWRLGKVPYTPTLFAALATSITRKFCSLNGASREVVVIDGEGSLWRSDGDRGAVAVEPAHQQLQEFLVREQDAGKILCLCTAESEDTVNRMLESQGMSLASQHLADVRAGGQPISEKLKSLAATFSIDLSNFVFVSANEANCAALTAVCPEVVVAQVPGEPEHLRRFLDHFWPFDRGGRAAQLIAGRVRTKTATFDEIAKSLTTVEEISKAVEHEQGLRNVKRADYAAPRNEVEKTLAEIWTGLLRVDKPGIHDNFFALGGHSLLAVQLIARVRQIFDLELALRTIFDAPTIAALAEQVEAARRRSASDAPPPLTRVQRDRAMPLSYAQQRLWFIDQLEPGNPLYNICAMYRLWGPVNPEALHRTVNEIVRRHESLRTSFRTQDGEPVQVIAPRLELPFPITVRTGLSSADREKEITRFAREQALQPFDLATGPLLRFSLLELDAEEHALVVILHHIVGDGWSGSVLATEMATLYGAFLQGRSSPLPELQVQYADFAVWQREWLQGKTLESRISYWKEQLSGAPPVLALPTDRPRPAVQAHRGAIGTRVIPNALIDRLRALSQSEGATLFMSSLSAFKVLLSRYSGQEDIVVGSTVAGRNYSETEPLIGFFVNTLALRTDVSGDPTFRELLERVKKTALDGYAHQEIPFERLVEELEPDRSLSYNPIFQVLFGLQNQPKAVFEAAGLRVKRESVHPSTSLFDMSWFAFETDEGLLLRVEYDTDLFEPETVERFLGHFEHLLHGIVENPERRISELPLMTEPERHRVLVEFNDTARDFAAGTCIHDFLAQQAKRLPEATALIHNDLRISYRELNERANQVAHFLIDQGAGPDVLIGIYCRRTPEMLVGILGVLKAGSAYVPLDPAYPKERLANILEDAKAGLVLTQDELLAELPPFSGRVICLDKDAHQIVSQPRTNPETRVTPQNLAYVLFTSGSTGRPKGVALEHHSAVNFIRWVNELLTPEELAGVLFCTSICFDMSTFEMFVTIGAGGKIILAENPLYLPTLAAKDEVTLINTVPSAMAELVRIGAVPSSLKTAVLAGEALPDSSVEEIYASTAVEKIFNMYGPTEVGYCTSTLVRRGEAVTIGKPLANTQGYILDKQGNPVPVGVPGEAYFSGEGVARGYYGRPDLTAERFLRNRFTSEEKPRMYRTGDLCRWLPDGNIQYLGRMDHQVKVRGFRVELGEIEAVLERHPAVSRSLVIAREDQPGLKRLVAYVVPTAGGTADPEQLRDHVKQLLPDFMVPSAVVVLNTFPLTPNGKIDRKALPEPTYLRHEETEYSAPRTPTEEQIAAIWGEVLHLPQIGKNDDFFSSGGHSLMATQVISRIRQTFQVELPLRTIFESPVLSALAEQVDAALHAHRALQVPSLRRVSRDQALPLSAAQQSMWFLDQLDPNSPAYNIPSTHRVESPLDLDILQRSLDALVTRHESLRTTFVAVEGQPQQIIAPSLSIPLDIADFSGSPEKESEALGFARVLESARKPFDLATGPLLRVTVARLAGGAQLLSVVIHHIISDRWSVGVLLRDLAELYRAEISGKPAALPKLPVQYADFASWQRELATRESFQKQIAYWKEELRGVPPVLELPTDRPRPAMESISGDMATLALSTELTEKLHALGRQSGTTLFMTLLAAFQALMNRYSGQDDFALGIPVAARKHPEIENLIGLFASTLPLRARLQSDSTFIEILHQVKEGLLSANANQDVPFEKLVEELQPERSLSHSPLVQVYFILQNAPVENVQFGNLEMKHVRTSTATSKGDLFFSLAEQNGRLTGLMEFKTDLFDRETIDRMLAHYRVLLEGVVANPELRLSQLPLLTREERQLMLYDWNATETEYPKTVCVHELFEQQAERTPNAMACIFGQQSLTYRELNEQANQLAHYLRKRGASPGQRIGLFVERSLRMMVGLLGIQKTGAAYVPVDPAYPAARITTMLEDAAVPVLVTEGELRSVVPALATQIVCLDTDRDEIARESATNLGGTAKAEDLIYVIYTSGSTGKPKGVQVPHRAVVNLLMSMAKYLNMGAGDVFPALASAAFDMSIPELYLALVTGGTVAIGERHLAGDGEGLARFLKDTAATLVHATPTTWNLLLQAGFTGAGLKRVIGAEAVPPELCARLLDAEPSLFNFYGPTETTVWSTFHHFTAKAERVVVGKPIANTQVYILDENLQPAPIGVAREIYIGGDGVARGYLNRAELSEQKFIPNPFAAPGARMYRTGDLGCYLPDGRIECLGRADSQVKVRGYRIELGEIEAVLAKHSGVQECVVLAREDVAGDKKLVGYIVPATGQATAAQELRAWIKDRLPDYMVPVAIVEMESFPLTPNGKVNRKVLPAPEQKRLGGDAAFIAARTPVEEIVAGIWTEVLRLDRVSTQDNFFELGGHSLLGTQVISRAREVFRVDLPLRAIFEAPTVAGLAERIEDSRRRGSTVAFAPLTRAQRGNRAPLSFAQQRLWFLDELEPQNPLYNVPYIVRLQGPMQAEILESSLNEIVRRHESLRTRFEEANGQPVQVIEDGSVLSFTQLDVSGLQAEARLTEARRLAIEETQRPFNLRVAPLIRAVLIKIAEDDHALVLNMHHIITDRWSFGVLSQELGAVYEAFLQGKASPLEELPLQYADYAIWQRQNITPQWMEKQVAYWRTQLQGAPTVLEIPILRPRQAMQNFWGGICNRTVPEPLVSDLRALSQRNQGTMFMTLMAAYQVLLAHLSGQEDVVVGTDLANRTQSETEKLIGFFVNLLPIRTRLNGDPSFIELLHRVREISLGAFAHQDVPFEKLVEELRPERSLTHHPLVQVLFVMQNTPRGPQEFGGLRAGPLGVSSTSRFDMVLFINNPDQSPVTTWMYNPNLFDEAMIARFADLYLALLRAVSTAPDLRLNAIFQVLGEEEQRLRDSGQKSFHETSLRKLKGARRKAAVAPVDGESSGA